MSTDTYNPFAEAEDWDVSTERWLQEGNYVVKIVNTEDESSQNGNPKLKVELEAPQGVHTDHVPYSCDFTRKIATLFRRAGAQDLGVGDFDPSDRCRLTPQARKRLIGRTVGVVIRNEADQNDPAKFWPRVQGYVDPARVKGHESDIGTNTRGLPDFGEKPGPQPVVDDALPF